MSYSSAPTSDVYDDDYPPALLQQLQLIDPSPIQSPVLSPSIPESHEALNNGYPHKGLVYYLIKTQRYSSYAFTGFLGIHLVTTGVLPLVTPTEIAENSLLLGRVLYHIPIIESTLVLGSVAAHALSGLTLRLYRGRLHYRKYGRATWLKGMTTLQWTGYALTPIAIVHFISTRGLPLYVTGGSEGVGLGFIAHGFARFPLISWSLYTSIVALGSYHTLKGWEKWLTLSKRWATAINGAIVGIAGVWLAGALRIARIGASSGHLGRHYDMLYDVLGKRV